MVPIFKPEHSTPPTILTTSNNTISTTGTSIIPPLRLSQPPPPALNFASQNGIQSRFALPDIPIAHDNATPRLPIFYPASNHHINAMQSSIQLTDIS